ncbi:transcriptional regulator [Klebsiella pneumoniae]|uniref:Transcriptional regulator n=1 Tax=Klebsiella pneumoniae TaxID=573 RepID=A0A2X3CLP6_KLEPN|nr:transcriptional regulator [Klebsiella pneumoniae]
MPRGWGWPAYCIIRRWMACATGSSVCCWKTSSRIRRRSICCIPLGIWRRLSCAKFIDFAAPALRQALLRIAGAA